jgi:MarR family transcriptional regulator, organic hydroperoxide resistance regulator
METKNQDNRITRKGGFLIAQIFQISGRLFARKMKEAGLENISPEQGRILFALWEKDGIPIQELTRRTSLRKSTMTAALDRLEKSGHVVRELSTKDRRQILIRVTEKDRQLQDAYSRLSDEMADLSYKGFLKKEIDAFEQALKRILANLKESEK